ncbi:sialate O-acetylesterase [Flavihumibacter stibioxidans]|uniref:9-O-acetylesterase n=1 Tax=Flavihumibacter stibioxidans TaxID=1834163 RepID=A0ABR7M9X0_9BACT|nr:sialate O-acetylesterase [Flavihumibacter stibioxidans]MBC6491319.1 9-O-acetylesterase [Flavihumibacter stibioxidans]
MKQLFIILLLMAVGAGQEIKAEIKLPRIIRDSMILQRDQPVNIWGWSAANENISLRFRGKTYRTRGNAAGQWMLRLPATAAGGPYTMEVQGTNTIRLKEILFGEVWFCSGQSNMVHQMNIHDIAYAKEIATANNPEIRQFLVPVGTSLTGPASDLPAGNWTAAVGENVRPFSAVAYFFAKKIQERYQVPVGIINASVGGTPIRAWIGEEGFSGFASEQELIRKNKNAAVMNTAQGAATPAMEGSGWSMEKGLSGDIKWYETGYRPAGWRNIFIPGYWEDQGLRDLDGTVWYRREINLPASMAGRPGKVFLGRIVDADELYINGKKIGHTGYQYPQRRYPLAVGILQAGKNTFVVRVTNHGGKGGFVPDKPYYLVAGEDTVHLSGQWQYKVGAVQTMAAPASGFSEQHQPSALYNAMVAPLTNYTIKGFCWYQGETDAGNPLAYEALAKAQIGQWRQVWNQGELPFLYVQLPGYMDYRYLPAESNWAQLREVQRKLLSVPRTGMAVAIDLGEWNDIHPDNKKDVGERLAFNALKIAYGENIVYTGPLFREAVTSGNKITLHFDHTGGGLVTSDGEAPGDIAIAGADKKFVWAKAVIEGNTILVWHDSIREPRYVRYAWADNPVQANIYNREGLPASPFMKGW